jgi:hypothetical protein
MLLSHRDKDDRHLRERSLHVHDIRKEFHKQLKSLWEEHPILHAQKEHALQKPNFPTMMYEIFTREGFRWLPIVTEKNGLICKLDILMLRAGRPGKVMHDVDNRLKTLFDALRMPSGRSELGAGTTKGQVGPASDEDPFYVLLEDDKFITHMAVTTDMLLDPVPGVSPDTAVRLVLNVTVRPYMAYLENLGYG